MSKRSTIKIDFKKAKEMADKLDDVSDKLDKVANKDFESTIQNLMNSWKGDNAEKFLDKSSILQNHLNDNAKEVQKIADDLRKMAKRIYDAEMKALRRAEKRDN